MASLNIISSILQLKGLYINDFFTNSFINTPMRTIINIFSFILPNNHLALISLYSLYSLFIKSLLPISFILLASLITILLHKQYFNSKTFYIKTNFLKIFFVGNFLFYLANQFKLIQIIIFGSPIADWNFPVNFASARGLSLFITIWNIILVLVFEIF